MSLGDGRSWSASSVDGVGGTSSAAESGGGARRQNFGEDAPSKLGSGGFDVRRNFLEPEVRRDYDRSPLTAFLRRMPKGGLLHVHGAAGVDFKVAAKLAVTDRLHVCAAPAEGGGVELQPPWIAYADTAAEAEAEAGVAMRPWRETGVSEEEMAALVYNQLMQKVGQEGHASTTECWEDFGVSLLVNLGRFAHPLVGIQSR